MLEIIVGNVSSLFAMITDSLSSTRKNPKSILLFQTLSQVFFGTSAIVLKGYSAAVQNVISIVRNLVAVRKKDSKVIEWILLVLAVIFGICFSLVGDLPIYIAILPVVANLEYSLAVLKFKNDERSLKIAFAVNTIMYVVFNAALMNFVAVTANIVVFITTVIFLIKDGKKAKAEA